MPSRSLSEAGFSGVLITQPAAAGSNSRIHASSTGVRCSSCTATRVEAIDMYVVGHKTPLVSSCGCQTTQRPGEPGTRANDDQHDKGFSSSRRTLSLILLVAVLLASRCHFIGAALDQNNHTTCGSALRHQRWRSIWSTESHPRFLFWCVSQILPGIDRTV